VDKYVFSYFLTFLKMCRWVVDVTGAAGTLYEGERFKLQFKFGQRYPFDSPEVILLLYLLFINVR